MSSSRYTTSFVRNTQLRGLELRGHSRLRELPAWLADLPALERLDVSFCRSLAPRSLTALTRLRVLALQVRRKILPVSGDTETPTSTAGPHKILKSSFEASCSAHHHAVEQH